MSAHNLAVDAARAHVARSALTETAAVGQVGLELEFHLVDLAEPARRPDWPSIETLVAGLPAMPFGSSITFEPGGQIELSAPPAPDVAAAVKGLQADSATLRSALASAGYGAAAIGADPARPAQRVNPHPRYAAMEQHFAALGCAQPGTAMMTATAALQVNLDAGPRVGWGPRLALIHRLGPVLTAMAASSPYLAGESSGWRSMRQQVWDGIDHSRSDPVSGNDPSAAWATYALQAPVMLVRDGETARPITSRVSLESWLEGDAPIERRPTRDDVDYHLTTLFPPVRPRGYVEIRCIDALPEQWWPAVAALTVTMLDDPIVADRARELCEPIRHAHAVAARDGLGDPAVNAAVQGCVEAAVLRCPPALKSEVEAYAELLASGRTPGDEIRAAAQDRGPLAALEEVARA
jgi:glutamate--cysteine ligase